MSKIKNGGLDQYGAEPFEQQQFETSGIEGVNYILTYVNIGRMAAHSDKIVFKIKPCLCLSIQ